MFERFTDRARRTVILADEAARATKHNYIGTEHLLLGMLREEGGTGAQVLSEAGVSAEAAQEAVVAIIGAGKTEGQQGHIPFTPRMKKVIELGLREGLQLGANYVGQEHLLLALIREGEGIAAQALKALLGEEWASTLRQAVLTKLRGYAAAERPRPAVKVEAVGIVARYDVSLSPADANALYNDLYVISGELGLAPAPNRGDHFPAFFALYDALHSAGVDGTA